MQAVADERILEQFESWRSVRSRSTPSSLSPMGRSSVLPSPTFASRASRKAVLQVRDLRLLRLPNSSCCGPNGCPYRSGEGIGPKGLFNQRKTFTYDLRSILAKT